MAVVVASPGCVVTSDPDFQGEDECVPFFLAHEADPTTSEIIAQTESATGADAFRASVPMRSCALLKDYTLHVFVDNDLRVISKIPPTEREVRNVSFLVDIGPERDNPGCHRVEAFVSTNFADFRTPVRAGDVNKITWFFINDPAADAASCGTL